VIEVAARNAGAVQSGLSAEDESLPRWRQKASGAEGELSEPGRQLQPFAGGGFYERGFLVCRDAHADKVIFQHLASWGSFALRHWFTMWPHFLPDVKCRHT
jgi:hypothetical protein